MRRLFSFVVVAGAFAFFACTQDNAATIPNDGSSASAGTSSSTCVAPKVSCAAASGESSCVDTSIDDANCGKCGNACGAGATCEKSECTCSDPTKSFCGGTCIDTTSDPKNCGGCNIACPTSTCTNGECEKIAFVTQSLYATSLTNDKGPLVAADAICQAEAKAAGFSGTFMAWLGDMSDSPATRFSPSTLPYILPDGTQVAADWTALTSGTLDHAIDQDSAKNTLDPSDDTRRVMTNVTASGAPGAPPLDCNEWTQTTGSVQVGDPTLTNSEWTDMTTAPSTWDCTLTYRLYCFAQ